MTDVTAKHDFQNQLFSSVTTSFTRKLKQWMNVNTAYHITVNRGHFSLKCIVPKTSVYKIIQNVMN